MIKNLERFPLTGPLRGFNDTDDETKLPNNMLVDVLNFDYVRDGIVTRSGYSAYSTSGLPSGEYINIGYEYKTNAGVKHLLIVTESDIYRETSLGVFASLSATIATGYPAYTATLAGLGLFGFDKNTPLKFNGTALRNLGVAAPTGAPSAAVNPAVGVLNGAYQYKITFVSEAGAETGVSPNSVSVSPSTEMVDLTSIQLGSAEVVSRKIYRTKAGGALYYYLDTIGNNTATTYTDNLSDSSLGTDLAPFENDPAPNDIQFLKVYKKYLFCVRSSEPTVLIHSYSSKPELFHLNALTGYRINIGGEDGQFIIGLNTLRETLFVFKEGSTWPLLGDNPDDFQVPSEPISHGHGFYHRSVAQVDFGQGDMLVGLTHDGFYAFDGYTYKNLGVQKEFGINITKFLDSLDKEQLKWATGYNNVAEGRYECTVRRSGMGYSDRVLVWDYRHNAIGLYDIAANSILDWNGLRLLCSSKSDGKVYRVGGFDDAGSAIVQKWELAWWQVGTEFNASFRYLYMNVVQWGIYSPQLTMYIDGLTQGVSISLAGTEDWGSIAWTTDKGKYYFTADIPIRDANGVNYKGRFVKFKMQHTGLQQPTSWYDMRLLFVPTKDQYRTNNPTTLGGQGL